MSPLRVPLARLRRLLGAGLVVLWSAQPLAAQSLFAPDGASPPAPAPAAASQPAPQAATPQAAGERRAPQAARQVQTRGSDSAQIVVDARGNKTLVVRGNDGPPKVMVNSGRQQTQVIFGDDTAGLVLDENGHKTLVVRGQSALPPSVGQARPGGEAEEKPYWVVDEVPEERPYFLAPPKTDDVPYWRKKDEAENAPYWQPPEEKYTRPYWLPKAEYVEVIAAEVQPAPVNTAAVAPPPDGGQRVISYYMYQDEQGVKHATDTPTDPRYRRFTAVVQVKVGRGGIGRGGGLGLGRLRFTHESLRPIIMKAASVYNLDPALIAAVIRSESAFDARAVSWAGAQGLMQLMPATARDMGVSNAFDPEQNIMGGSRYLRLMLNEFNGDLSLALAAYNAGPNRVKRNWSIPNIAETQNYVKIVTRNYERYRSQF